ncbi:MAG: type II toxin-antitoxin system VapC family toxin [Gemmatimonadota bacterium]|jgi:hypothetical protein
MIFVDSNVPMYLVGAEHPNKHAARRILERLIAGQERLVTAWRSSRRSCTGYTSIRRRDAIEPCIAALLGLADEVYPVELDDVLRARDLLVDRRGLSARDALHVAAMERRGIRRILSSDAGFDAVEGIDRLWE